MKTIEIILLAEDIAMLEKLLLPLKADITEVFNIQVYRVMIEENLSLLIYPFLFDQKPPGEWFNIVRPFLGGAILLLEKESITKRLPVCEKLDEMVEYCGALPTVVALRTSEGQDHSNAVFTLQDRRRFLFWDDSTTATGEIWQTLIGQIPVEEITVSQ